MQVMRVSQELAAYPSRAFKKASSSQTATAAPVPFGGRQWGTSQNSSRDTNTFEAGNIFEELQVLLLTFKKAKGIWFSWSDWTELALHQAGRKQNQF